MSGEGREGREGGKKRGEGGGESKMAGREE